MATGGYAEGKLTRKLSKEVDETGVSEEENFETHKELIKKLSEVEDRPHVEGKLARKLSADVDPETGISEVENFDTHKEFIRKQSQEAAEANLSAAA